MVCVGLSEGDMKNFGGPLGGQAKFWGTVATPAPHPSSAPGDIPTPLHVLKMLRPETDVSPSPWPRHCLQDRIISLLQVMHTAKYTKVQPSYKNYHMTYTSKQKP